MSEPDSPTSVEEVDSNPRPTRRLPHTSSPLSVTGCISAWEQHAAQESRQDYVSLGTPTRAHTPGDSTVSQARRRAGCWTKEKNEANPPPLDLIERNYKVSELATGRTTELSSENWCLKVSVYVLCIWGVFLLMMDTKWRLFC